jgi:hypothetical protein
MVLSRGYAGGRSDEEDGPETLIPEGNVGGVNEQGLARSGQPITKILDRLGLSTPEAEKPLPPVGRSSA